MKSIHLCLLTFVVLSSSHLRAAEPFRFQGSSNLPLLILDTAGQAIPDEPKLSVTMSILDKGAGKSNRLDDQPAFTGVIGIELRGSSSRMFDKKSYGLETRDKKGKNLDVSLLGMPKESDWILYGPHSDKTLIRNFLAYHLSNQIGRYAPRTRFVEVFLRDKTSVPLEQQYVGVYLLMEKIKRGNGRVDIPKLNKKKDKVAGGYILRVDRVDGPESYFTTAYGNLIGHVYPRGKRLGKQRRDWIRTDFDKIEHSLASDNFRDPQNGYAKYLDADSFIDFFFLNEMLKNVDAYWLSTFFHKAADGKLHMGPIWDFNLSLRNASYGGVWRTDGWILFERGIGGGGFAVPFWWDRLFEDPKFVKRLIDRWKELRGKQFSLEKILQTVDQTAKRLDQAQQRNFQRWPILGNYIWPNPRPYAKTYPEEIQSLKTWLRNRIQWIDENIGELAERF